MQSMQYLRPGEYFNQQEVQQLVNMATTKKNIGDIVVHEFTDEKNHSLNNLKIIEVVKEVDLHDKKYIKHMIHSNYYGGTGLYINSNSAEHITQLIAKCAESDEQAARSMLVRYHQEFLESREALTLASKVFKETLLMRDYLSNHHLRVGDLKMDINRLEALSGNKEALEDALQELVRDFPKPIKIPGYNDLDYYPYLFEDTYVIEDVSADTMLLCQVQGSMVSWYQTNRWLDTQMHDWISETLYDHHQLPKLHLDTLDDFSLIAQFVDGKLTKATVDLSYLNLLQGYIVSTLVESRKIQQTLPALSFEELLNHYAFQKEAWQIQERAIVELLKDIKVVDGQLTYEGFSEIDPQILAQTVQHEKIAEHHLKALLPPKEEEGLIVLDLDSDSFDGLSNLSQAHRASIQEFLQKLRERDPGELTQQFTHLIEEKLGPVKPKKKM